MAVGGVPLSLKNWIERRVAHPYDVKINPGD
jgi:hypothetical protein